LVVGLPVVAQEDEGNAFFTLSSDRTFTASDTPVVRLWGQGFNKLEFRLYRVNDPVAFFRRLRDDHEFGAEAPRSATQRTWIERIRDWKLARRGQLKSFLRSQFTAESRREYVGWRLKRAQESLKKRPTVVQSYANVPVLNAQQLVSRWEQPFSTANRWESASIPVPIQGKGLYLVEATDGRLQAYTILSVTDLGVITKASPGRLLIRVVERTTGAPVRGCELAVFTKDRNKRVAEGRTDAQGLMEAAVGEERPETVLVLARDKDNFAAVSMYGGNLATGGEDSLKGYIYTDRPVYRPGHAVHYRLVFRTRETAGYRVPGGREVSVDVQDNDGQSIYRTKVTLSAMGTASGRFVVPASAKLGYHSIEARLGGALQSGGFDVEEYRKPEYEVRVVLEQRRVLQGAAIQAVIDARYFYGEPVADAKVTWVVHKQRFWAPYFDEENDDYDDTDGDSRYAQREQILEESGRLDAQGKLAVSIPTGTDENDMRYRVEARVTDAGGREIAGTAFAVATVGSYLLNVRSDRYFYGAKDSARFTIETRDYDGNRVPGVPFELALMEWNWRQQGGKQIGGTGGTTGADGSAVVTMPLRAGSLRAVVRSRTPEGRVIEDTQYLWVEGGGEGMGSSERLTIVPDRKSYKPGEVAKVLLIAPRGSNLWVTVEGQAVHQSRFVTSKEGSVTLDVPIQREFVPNFFVSAVTIRGSKLIQGNKLIRVPPVEQQLNVELKPAKTEYKPGEAGSYLVEVKDWAGKPVSGEFSLGVVDEAVYSVRPDSVPDIVSHFYGRQYNRVSTDSSLHYYFHGQAGKRQMQLARVRPLARAQLKPDRLVQPKVRKAFPDTTFWSAGVTTDGAGRATVRLDYPDALTTWRATARGITADTKVGSALNRVIVRKNLLIRLSTPQFFRQGDVMTITAIAQNFLSNEKRVRVSLETKGLELVEGTAQDLTVPSRGTGTADFRVRVPGGQEAVLLAKALTNEESDALELTIPVVPFGVKMSEVRGGSFAGDADHAETELTIPADAEPGSGVIEISASASPASAIFEALDYLTSFPYGCTEQTMSSFLPNVIVSQAVRSLGLQTRVDPAELDKKVRAGLDRLYDFQHEDGGWGWWKTDESTPFMTAYVLAGLKQAKNAGYPVPPERIADAAKWLAESGRLDREPVELQAYSLYALALAGTPDQKRMTSLLDQRSKLAPYALALLGLALEAAGDLRSREVAGLLELKAKSSELEAWWEMGRDPLLDIDIESSPEATAWALKLLSSQRPQSSLLSKAALYLVNHRSQGFYWNSTKQTAMVVYGLTGYLKQSGELKPNLGVNVLVNDRPVARQRFSETEGQRPVLVRVSASGRNRVRVVRNGTGRVYWRATARYHSQRPAPGGGDWSLRREYFRLVPVQEGSKLVHGLEPLAGPVKQGEVLAVKLTARADGSRYLMIEDPVPAGTEIVARDDLYELKPKPDWWTRFFTERELRDDRAVFFERYLDRGPRTYFYLLKVINPGQFRVSPARLEPMYQPARFASSDANLLEVSR
jgi:hypothetical protein